MAAIESPADSRWGVDASTLLGLSAAAECSTVIGHATMQASLGQAEAQLRSGRAFLYETLAEAWRTVGAGEPLGVARRAMLWLAATHAANAAKNATELMFTAGGSAAPYASAGVERCLRDIHPACQHVTLARGNCQMAGQAFLDLDMRATPLLFLDDRSGA